MFIIHSIQEGKLTVRWQFGAHGVFDCDVTQHADDITARAHARELFKEYAIRQTERLIKASRNAHLKSSSDWSDEQRFSVDRLTAFVNYSLASKDSFEDFLQHVVKLERHYMRILPPKKNLYRGDIESVVMRLMEDTHQQIVDWRKSEKQHQRAS